MVKNIGGRDELLSLIHIYGMKSYSRVVQLLLEYYDGILYFTGEDGTALPIPMLAAGEALISSSSD